MAKRESGTVSTRGIGVPKFNQEMLAATIAALAGITLVWTFSQPEFPVPVLIAAGAVFTVSIVMVIRLMMDPDSVRALQSDAMLQLASSMIDAMGDGLTEEASQEVCELLLPNTSAIAVALTNCESVLGYAGYQEAHNPAGIAIRTSATHECIRRGKTLVLLTPEEIGLPAPIEQNRIKAAIVEPLFVGGRVEGTLKFYYRDPRKITETQRSIAHGFAQLLATQMAAVEMETQRKLAASMELKMLQTQINPHFLFNTINTIASFIRTDPMKARTLLREFAVFYRRTLEDSTERISLARELDQVQRYFNFELARFGDARLAFEVNASPALLDMMVPPFLVQPLVENAIKHAMPSEGKLTITVRADADGDDVVIVVSDAPRQMRICVRKHHAGGVVHRSRHCREERARPHDRLLRPRCADGVHERAGGGHPGDAALPRLRQGAGVCGGIGGSARSVVGRGGRGSGGKRGEGGAQQRHHGRADRACGPGVGIKPDPAFFVDKMLVTDGRSPSRNVLERGLLTQKSWIDLLG